MPDPTADDTYRHVQGFTESDVLVLTLLTKQLRDVELAYAVRDEIISMVTSCGTDKVVLDLREVEFIGSVGLLALLGLRRHLDTSEGRIVICNCAEPIFEMFRVCRLISVEPTQTAPFEAETTLAAALARFTA